MKNILNIVYKILLDITLLIIFFAIINHNYKHDLLNDKKYLLNNNPIIYFAGDSRALFQLRPDIASKYLGIDKRKIANIARIAGHPLEVENLIKKNTLKFKDATVIISVSAYLINGNAKTPHHYSMDLIARKNIFEQIYLFNINNILTLQKYYSHVIMSLIHESKEKSFVMTNGYSSINTNADINLMTYEKLSNDPWYSGFYIDRSKINDIDNSLKSIKTMCKTLIVINGPLSITFIEKFKDTDLYKIEKIFDIEMKQICSKDGIKYLSYYNNNDLKDEYFADWAHLNYEGSELFTIKVLKDINYDKM